MHSVIHSYIKYMSSPRIQLGFLTHHLCQALLLSWWPVSTYHFQSRNFCCLVARCQGLYPWLACVTRAHITGCHMEARHTSPSGSSSSMPRGILFSCLFQRCLFGTCASWCLWSLCVKPTSLVRYCSAMIHPKVETTAAERGNLRLQNTEFFQLYSINGFHG